MKFYLFHWDRALLCSSGWPKNPNLCTSTSKILVCYICANMPDCITNFQNKLLNLDIIKIHQIWIIISCALLAHEYSSHPFFLSFLHPSLLSSFLSIHHCINPSSPPPIPSPILFCHPIQYFSIFFRKGLTFDVYKKWHIKFQ